MGKHWEREGHMDRLQNTTMQVQEHLSSGNDVLTPKGWRSK